VNERISALMDGELDDQAAAELIPLVSGDREALATWRTYHLISDAIRENQPLARAPVVPLQPRRWVALPVAASLAAVALVGWLAFAPQPEPPGAVAKAPTATAPAAAQPAPQRAAVAIPLPNAAADYLLAHQGVSPRASFQGMAPYVRSVSAEAREAAR
jgi:sigma-E factor negative regulatory protein RseA